MKNLIEKAKEFNLFTREELPSMLFDVQPNLNYSYREKIDDAKINLPSDLLNKYNPTLLFQVKDSYNYKNEYDYTYLDHIYTIFETPKGNLALMRGDKGKYSFFPFYGYFRLGDINYNTNRELKESGIKEPNRIGVFSDKKIIEWLNFVDLKIELLKSIKDRNTKANDKIKEDIERIKNEIGGKIVSAYKGNTIIEKEGFLIEIEHDKSCSYLSTKIRYRGDIEKLINLLNRLN
jgi:hypothetical protein